MSIMYPVVTMAFLTFFLGLFVLFARIRSVSAAAVPMSFYEVFMGGEPPVYVLKTTRHWANLFEAPVLFYVACLAALVLNLDQVLFVQLAWAYVVVRMAHSLIHLTYNRVSHRLTMFLLSQGVLIVMWVILLLHLAHT
jgi:hypothetical protein